MGLVHLMVTIIESPRAGLDLVEAAGELIAETARFNISALQRKPDATERELWNLATVEDRCMTECTSAWDSYCGAADNDPAGRERLRWAVQSAIGLATERLRAARTGDPAGFEDPDLPEELLGW
jgi:hypothetical protein